MLVFLQKDTLKLENIGDQQWSNLCPSQSAHLNPIENL